MRTTLPQVLTTSLLFFLLFGTAILYWPGLNSPFIFDDIPNLNMMGAHESLGTWRDMLLFILQGDSGPTGRPVSLASFYLDDNLWKGASATDFKYTNLMLHLLNGVVVFWLALKLFYFSSLTQYSQRLAALLTTALWILHPIQLNTVLYVIQRMTELSALFTLSGLLCYIYGREMLDQTPKKAWTLLLGGCGISLILAVLSKENGVLLVVYILAIEYCLIRPKYPTLPKNLNIGLYLTTWTPFTLLALYLANIGWNQSGYDARPFSLTERLMSEARIIWDYADNIFIPNLRGSSLFHDDYIISKNLTDPLSTLPAIAGILLLVILLFTSKKSYPIASFAIAWFLGGHLLESTTLSLELYFEHRNYLPLFGIAFAIAYYTIQLQSCLPKIKIAVPIALSCYLVLMVFVTWQGVKQWANPIQMIAGWTQDHPQSQRTLEALDALIGPHISLETRENLQKNLLAISKKNNTSSYLILKELALQCKNTTLASYKLDEGLRNLSSTGYVAATPKAYADLISQWLSNRCGDLKAQDILAFTEKLHAMKQLQHGKMSHLLHYWQAEIQADQGNLGATMQHHEASYKLSPSLDSLLIQANYLASAGLYSDAINKLQQAEKDLCTDTRSCLILKLRQPSIDAMMGILHTQLEQQKKADNHAQAIHYSTR